MILRIKKGFDGHPKGKEIKVDAKKGIPLDIYWRRRLADAEIDGCVEVVKSKKRGK